MDAVLSESYLLTCGDVKLSGMKIFALTILFSFIIKLRFPKDRSTTTTMDLLCLLYRRFACFAVFGAVHHCA